MYITHPQTTAVRLYTWGIPRGHEFTGSSIAGIDPALVWPPLLYTHREGLNKILQSSAETGGPIDPMIKKSTVPPFTSDL